jgi:hypothetical protein
VRRRRHYCERGSEYDADSSHTRAHRVTQTSTSIGTDATCTYARAEI